MPLDLIAQAKYCARAALARHGLETATDAEPPTFMIHDDAANEATSIVRKLNARGFFCCPRTFPAVPMNKPSIRCTVSRHNRLEDIEDFVAELSRITAELEAVPAAVAQAQAGAM